MSLSSTQAELEAIDPCQFILGTDIKPYYFGFLAVEYSTLLYLLLAGISESPTLVLAGSTIEPPSSPEFSQNRPLLEQLLLLVENFFFWMDKLFSPIKESHSVLLTWADHKISQVLTAHSSRQQGSTL
jgi:hypothetical protein